MTCRPKQKVHLFDFSCCIMMSQNDETAFDVESFVRFYADKHNVPGTVMNDRSLLETHILECLYDQPDATASIHELFACLKDRQIIPLNESKKRTNRALHNLVRWHVLSQTFENGIPTYFPNLGPKNMPASKMKSRRTFFAESPSEEDDAPASPICSPPPKGQSSYLPLGYDAEELKPHNFQTNHEIESCVKYILDEVKLFLNSGVGRNMQVSHVEFRIDVHRLLVPKLSTRRKDVLQLSLKYALLAMKELGWKCHMTKQIQWNSQHVIIPIDTQLILTC